MPETTNTGAPTATIDPSFEDIENLLAASVAPAAATQPEQTRTDPTPQVADPKEPAAATVETPVAEPGKKETPEETPAPQTQEPVQQQEPTPDGQDKGKKKSDIDKRLASLAHKRREAESKATEANRQLEETRAENERLRRELEARGTGQPGPGRQADGSPATRPNGATFDKAKPELDLKQYTQPGGKHFKEGEDYDDAIKRGVTEFNEAYADWRDERRGFEDAQNAQAQIAEDQKRGFINDVRAAMDEHPDFEDARDWVLSHSPENLQIAISQLPRFSPEKAAWTEVVQHLGDNPDELQTLVDTFNENQVAGIAELGRIYHSLKPAAPRAKAAPAAPAPQAQPKTPKEAPTPPVVVGGGGAPAPVDLEKADMDTFAREVAKYL